MSRKKKLIDRLLSNPKDFTFDEAKALLGVCGYIMNNSGKTSGSRVRFEEGNRIFRMHKPHPGNELKSYAVTGLINELKGGGHI